MDRKALSQILFDYLNPLLPNYGDSEALLYLAGGGAQYEDEVIPMEAWARQLWGLAPYWAGGFQSAGGTFERIYCDGLIAGTDPQSGAYWGDCRDHDQKFVEMAAIAYALLLAPNVLWEPLSDGQRERAAAWLGIINEHSCPAGNWLWFQALVNLALRELGMPYSQQILDEDLRALDDFYDGDGWYKDGPTGLPDYYNAMTFQFFSILYIWKFGSRDAVRAAAYLNRLKLFAADYVKLFSARGEAVPYGRSMVYRFAQSGFWSIAAAAGVCLGHDFDIGTLKGLIVRNIKAWDPSSICDNGHVLSLGYKYPNQHMCEGYNAAGSPYWCLMAFACLALPEDDRFWSVSETELALPPRAADDALGKTALVARDDTGEVVLYPSGRVPGHPFAQSDNKYSKFAYSTRFGFSVARSQRSLGEAAPDSMLAFVVGGRVFVRDGVDKSEVVTLDDGRRAVRTSWSPCPGIDVVTEVIPLANGQLRNHVVKSAVECVAFDAGFAVPGDYHWVTLEDIDAACRVDAVGQTEGERVLLRPEANTNIDCGKTVIPAVKYVIGAGVSKLATCVVVV